MRIAQIAPLYETVPPRAYGGTERVVSWLTEELVRRGHQVTLFATADSRTRAHLVPVVPRALRLEPDLTEVGPSLMMELGMVYERAESFDVIHSHVDYFGFPFAHLSSTPTLTTVHGRVDLPALQPIYRRYSHVPLVSISNRQREAQPGANWVATVYHGIPTEAYPAAFERGSYFAFLGRIAPEKGLEEAAEVARRAGKRLKVAAKLPSRLDHPREQAYREQARAVLESPHVDFLGEVDHQRKVELLREAAALLFPIRWPEPFGLVMVEAMACGTPVIARPRGSVPEVIADGVTGFICQSTEAMVEACARLDQIDRRACRRRVEEHFSVAAMADAYEMVYASLLANGRGRRLIPPRDGREQLPAAQWAPPAATEISPL